MTLTIVDSTANARDGIAQTIDLVELLVRGLDTNSSDDAIARNAMIVIREHLYRQQEYIERAHMAASELHAQATAPPASIAGKKAKVRK